ncbi:MAG TPA: hypothetical protein VFF72_05120, partial [Caldimonas sp.]|nr:hypothetical protein [Caldimonas sp.]
VVKKRSEELFAEFEKRLRAELVSVDQGQLPTADVDAGQPPRSVENAALAPVEAKRARGGLTLSGPRAGIGLALGVVVALAASVFGGSPWWWLALPALAVAGGLRRRNA